MTFKNFNIEKKNEWELLRFCNKLGYNIPNAFISLLSYFEKKFKPNSLICCIDRRWSQGNFCKQSGFKLDNICKPIKWYWKKSNNLLSSNYFQTHVIQEKTFIIDKNKTKQQNIENNGYHIIYDCGKLVFKKNY